MIEILELRNAGEKQLLELNGLLRQLRSNPADHIDGTMEDLQEMITDKNTVVVVAADKERIVGMGLLFVMPKVGERIAEIHDVVVDSSQRGKGLGESITKKLIEAARERRVHLIGLTSRPSRIAANGLYQKIGFQSVETNVYRLKM